MLSPDIKLSIKIDADADTEHSDDITNCRIPECATDYVVFDMPITPEWLALHRRILKAHMDKQQHP